MVEAGQRARVVLLKAVWGWAGSERTIVEQAGTTYEGIVGEVDADEFFPLLLDDGSILRFSIYDSGIAVKVLAPSAR
jgi:hypothetical protein